MMALIGPQLTGGALPVSLYWFHCEAMGREGGGVGEAGFEGNSCWRWHSQEHPCDRPPLHPSAPLPHPLTHTNAPSPLVLEILVWTSFFQLFIQQKLQGERVKSPGLTTSVTHRSAYRSLKVQNKPLQWIHQCLLSGLGAGIGPQRSCCTWWWETRSDLISK